MFNLGAIILLFIFPISQQYPQLDIASRPCNISIDHLNGDVAAPQPLVLIDSEVPAFLLPSKNGFLEIKPGESIRLVCPGNGNFLRDINTVQSVRAVCRGDKSFMVGFKSHHFSEFRCRNKPMNVARSTGESCLKNQQQYEIGFLVGDKFLRTLEICRDDKTYTTLYSRYSLPKEISGREQHYPKTLNPWKVGPFYEKLGIANSYNIGHQRMTISKLLGSIPLAKKYIKTDLQFLTRGHLTPRADFIYDAQQSSTFWFLNTAPQWRSFNSGNWMLLETEIRNFAANRNLNLEVYTGVHGYSTLIDEHGKEHVLYLHANQTHKALPVPRYFWKIMHDPISRRATAFIGLNEPFAKKIQKDVYICPDISSYKEFSWLSWDPKNIEKGISYICTVRDLRKAVPTIPELAEEGLLY